MKLRWKTDWEREGNVIIGVKMETAQKKIPQKQASIKAVMRRWSCYVSVGRCEIRRYRLNSFQPAALICSQLGDGTM